MQKRNRDEQEDDASDRGKPKRPAKASAYSPARDTTKPEQLQAAVLRLNQRKYMSDSSMSQPDEMASSYGQAGQRNPSHNQEEQRASGEGPSSSASTGSSIQVNPVQTPPQRGLHSRFSGIASTSPSRRKAISLSKSKKPSPAPVSPLSPSKEEQSNVVDLPPASSSATQEPSAPVVAPVSGMHSRAIGMVHSNPKRLSLSKKRPSTQQASFPKPVLPTSSLSAQAPSAEVISTKSGGINVPSSKWSPKRVSGGEAVPSSSIKMPPSSSSSKPLLPAKEKSQDSVNVPSTASSSKRAPHGKSVPSTGVKASSSSSSSKLVSPAKAKSQSGVNVPTAASSSKRASSESAGSSTGVTASSSRSTSKVADLAKVSQTGGAHVSDDGSSSSRVPPDQSTVSGGGGEIASSSTSGNQESPSPDAVALRVPFTVECDLLIDTNDLLPQAAVSGIQKAFDDAQSIGFNESINNCTKFLASKHVVIDGGHRTLCNVLNGVSRTECKIHDNQGGSQKPKDMLLLYCLASHLQSAVYVFSTRHRPVLVSPSAQEQVQGYMALLVHKDSYMQKTHWYPLRLDLKSKVGSARAKTTLETPIVATRKQSIAQASTVSSSKPIAKGYEKDIEDILRASCFSIFRKKWDDFRSSGNTSIQDFKATLSVKSFPENVVQRCSDAIENKMRAAGTPLSRNPQWLSRKLHSWKTRKKNPFGVVQLVEEFIAIITKEQNKELADQGDDDPIEVEDGTSQDQDDPIEVENDISQDLDDPIEIEDDTAQVQGQLVPIKEYHTISRSLKSVIKPQADYQTLLLRMTNLQNTCHHVVYGLSQCVSTLVNMIIEGECSAGAHPGYLDFSRIDLHQRGIGAGAEQAISLVAPIKQDVLDLFNFAGFYKIACAVVGQKNLTAHSADFPILQTLSTSLPANDRVTFVCGPWVQDACRRFLTNFINMWSPASCVADLRVVMEMLLRIHLCSQRFFNPKVRPKKTKKQNKVKIKAPSKDYAMSKLFWALVHKDPKQHVVDFFTTKVFKLFPTPKDITTAATVSASASVATAMNPYEKALQDGTDASEDEEEEDGILLAQTPDLPAKDIRALTSVACFLCQSPEHPTVITMQHVKEKLYHDKQDCIPSSALETTASLVSAVRSVTPKEDQAFSLANWIPMRALRNTLVEFAGSKTKRRVSKLCVDKKKDTNSADAVRIDHAALYHLFSNDHNLHLPNGIDKVTSVHVLKTIEQKVDLLNNFLKINKIKGLFQERKLTFAGYFLFSNQYDLHFAGYKIVQPVKQADIATRGRQERSGNQNHEAEKQLVKELTKEIKDMRKTYTANAKELRKLELARMQAGNKSRTFERRNKRRDPNLYRDLKDARDTFNKLHAKQAKLLQEIQERQSRMYILNKKIHNQRHPPQGSHLDPKLAPIVAASSTVVQGIDPGIVTAASGVGTYSRSLFEAVNRFQAISNEEEVPHPKDQAYPFSLTANMVNTAVLSHQHRKQREKKDIGIKKQQRNTVIRRCRLKKYHQRKVASDNAVYHQPKGAHIVTFTGNWSGSGAYIKGHARRSTKLYYSQLGAGTNHSVVSVDEYKSTVTCSSCFHRTSKQVHLRDGHIKRIPGAVVCLNVKCPRRLTSGATTVNRDLNDAKNIALIGFSSLAAQDGLALPPFRRSHNTNKYILSQLFLAHQSGEVGIPT
ncbi:hypothetical protein FB192DRAFT_1458774 [Mucor lusitanicus]|uniref:Uncharacterized protein n=1 Tax=Mucor circinelloides f. lusitanicus TaxID=29924 RepID=A0A8H4EZG7_MUCCL|nr:hypothetical protein FB192DRAFT_1458774 [Mucor lusitanicus]